MRTLLILLLTLTTISASPGDSILRVNVTQQTYSPSQPWEKTRPVTRRGLGTKLADNRILTTAAIAADAIYIELKSADSISTVPAKVTAIDYEVNLAILEPLSQADFLTKLTPATLSEPCKTGDILQILQIENKGSILSTDGTIRSIDLLSTFGSGGFFLGYVVKASMQTTTNSFTLPAFKNNKLAGLLTSYDAANQLCDVISIDIISSFLKDAQDGDYQGFPSLGVSTQTTEDPHFRRWLQLDNESGGLYVSRVLPDSSASRAGLEKSDVILSVGGFPISRRAYYQHPDYGTLLWPHLVRGSLAVGEKTQLEILRNGEKITLDVTMSQRSPQLVPTELFGQAPPFLIKGGLVFQELSKPYLQAFGKDWTTLAPLNLLDVLSSPEDYEEGRNRVVVLTRVLATEATIGYEALSNQIVEKINGQKITNLPDLAAALEKTPQNGIHSIELDSEPYKIHLNETLSDSVDKQFLQRGLPSLNRLY